MPELPEVEVTRTRVAPHLEGARIAAVRMGLPLRWPLGVAPQALTGRRVVAVRRRGKYLLFELDQGLLLLHLGMSGSLRWLTVPESPGQHDHFDLVTDRGTLRLHDPRRFGAVVYADRYDDPVAQRLLGGLGVEPLEDGFEPQRFHAALRGRRAPIKTVLMAGDVVVGVGNIYASESLFLARIRPTTPAMRLSRARVARLHGAVREVLQRALAVGGSTLRDFSADGHMGCFQLETWVYDRAGQPCRVCGTPIRCIRQGQRSTYFCPRCQAR